MFWATFKKRKGNTSKGFDDCQQSTKIVCQILALTVFYMPCSLESGMGRCTHSCSRRNSEAVSTPEFKKASPKVKFL